MDSSVVSWSALKPVLPPRWRRGELKKKMEYSMAHPEDINKVAEVQKQVGGRLQSSFRSAVVCVACTTLLAVFRR